MSLFFLDEEFVKPTLIGAAAVLKTKPKVRKAILIWSIVLLFAFTIIATLYYEVIKENNILQFVSIIFPISLSIIILICILSYIGINTTDANKFLENLMKQREELNKKVESREKENTIFDVVSINVNQLTEYYTINKIQAKRSYSLSVICISIGFIAIITSVVFMIWNNDVSSIIAIITCLGGVIAEFIGGTCLYLYKQNSAQIKIFFEKLSYLQHVMLANELTEKLSKEKKEEQIAAIISSLIEIRSSNS